MNDRLVRQRLQETLKGLEEVRYMLPHEIWGLVPVQRQGLKLLDDIIIRLKTTIDLHTGDLDA